MNVFFTSDLHFNHENVIRFDKRPWNTVEEMNHGLMERWNRKVQKGDLVYVLGDLFWKGDSKMVLEYLNNLNGQIYMIKGNHDRWLHNAGVKNRLAGVKDYLDTDVPLKDGMKRRVILSHYFIPFYNGHLYNAIMLHGHSHNTEEYEAEEKMKVWLNQNGFPCRAYNVGCMHWNYEPVTLDEILERSDEYEKYRSYQSNVSGGTSSSSCINRLYN